MAPKPFHLAWFCTFIADSWMGTWGSDGSPWNGQFYVDLAKDLERACFDYVLLEDKSVVATAFGNSMESSLKYASVPKHDPMPLATLMAHATDRIGIAAAMSTSFYPPWITARLAATIDHIADGRFGWSVVTTVDDLAAENFGQPKLPEHDTRYDIADEYVDLVCQLWDSWEPDSIVRDRTRGVYADYTKVHAINFEGKYFKCRGPLNTAPPPQGRPVLVHSSRSPRGRQVAAKYADTIVTVGNSVEDMKEYRQDIHRLLAEHGRSPDSCKILFMVNPVVDETDADAHAKVERWITDPTHIAYMLNEISKITAHDFSQYDLDKPLPDDITTDGERYSFEKFIQRGSGKALRELVGLGIEQTVPLIGSPDTVAERMGEIMAEVGGDGYLVNSPSQRLNRRYITEITDGLVPALQRRGLVRTAYDHRHFRDNLMAF
ncbi:NtaA/DmoA family FMN-dependent monooxygenase [Kribbella sp. NPDC004536]|uniref:NtaA/DmoA family FMN-dependent monooxygenase n=1 Tax=Kribbella sp. NPDC004536 TaxID=3364106 RepID=UPI0036B13707